MRRRRFIAGAIAIVSSPRGLLAQPAQPAEKALIGFIGSSSPQGMVAPLHGVARGLAEGGFVDGQNVTIDYRWAEDRYERLAGMAAELIGRRPRVIVAAAFPAAYAAKTATGTIPIVFFSGGDPVEQGLVQSFNRPGGNLTGVCAFLNDLGPKRLDLLGELVPQAAAIAFLGNPTNPNLAVQLAGMREAARAKGVRLIEMTARTEGELDRAFSVMANNRVAALVLGADPFLGSNAHAAVLALQDRLPAIGSGRRFVEAGGLAAYGNDLEESYHQIGVYAAQVLKGANPAELPIVRSTKFELLLNLKTAKALGVTVPPIVLTQTDEVIE